MSAIWGDAQAGWYGFGACIWHGTPESRIDLAPGVLSGVYAMRGNQQAGFVAVSGIHAAVWRGTASSLVDLHPAGYNESHAYATDGEYQGGYATAPGGGPHAALWHGSAGSFIDLNPASSESEVWGMAPGQQVGYVFGPAGLHAAVWSGSAVSYQDMHPGGGGLSQMYATNGAIQAGYVSNASTGGAPHAGIWFGSASSFLDIHSVLPPGFSESAAYALYQDGNTLYVGGHAWRNGHYEGILWTGTIPAPGPAIALLAGFAVAARRR